MGCLPRRTVNIYHPEGVPGCFLNGNTTSRRTFSLNNTFKGASVSPVSLCTNLAFLIAVAGGREVLPMQSMG